MVLVDGLLDDPDALKKVDCMPDGDEKEDARKALPVFPPAECAGNAKKDFELVNQAVEATIARGEGALVHCFASLSRSAAFIIANIMKTRKMTVVEAAGVMRLTWGATWPNDSFVHQLIAYDLFLFTFFFFQRKQPCWFYICLSF